MSKSFRPWRVDERLLLRPSVRDFVPADHLSRFVVSLVRESLELGSIYGAYKGEKGQPPYDPAMMVALLLYSYAVGIYSSRRIAGACRERTDFLMIVALDGTKVKANASKHKAMSYGHMRRREEELAAEVRRWLAAAEAADAEEDRLYGDRRGDEMPDWVKNKRKRIEKIREAKAALEAAAEAAAAEETRRRAAAEERRKAEGRKKSGKTAAPPSAEPDGKAQRNFTDPDSRILKTKDGFIPGYNAQAAVDSHAQVIVAQSLAPGQSDQDQLIPLIDAIEANLGRHAREASADAGYCSEKNLAALDERGIAGYVAVARAKRAANAKRHDQRHAHSGDATQAQAGRATNALPVAQAGGGTGVRTDQAGKRVQAIPVARDGQSEGRMGDDLYRPQHPQARKGNRMNRSLHLTAANASNTAATWTGY